MGLAAGIGILITLFLFAWFPRHPAHERERYRDTRVTLFPLRGLLFSGHDRPSKSRVGDRGKLRGAERPRRC